MSEGGRGPKGDGRCSMWRSRGDVSRLEWDAILLTALDDLAAVDDQIEKRGKSG